MPKYLFVTTVTISIGIEIEADHLVAAIEAAQESPMASLCHHCARQHPGQWSAGEVDADPTSGQLVDLYVDGQQPDGEFERAVELWGAEPRREAASKDVASADHRPCKHGDPSGWCPGCEEEAQTDIRGGWRHRA